MRDSGYAASALTPTTSTVAIAATIMLFPTWRQNGAGRDHLGVVVDHPRVAAAPTGFAAI